MRKTLKVTLLTAAMSLCMGITAFAAGWQKDQRGWRWENGDGSFLRSTWEWLDGNNDGVAECYYFDGSGYCVTDTKTPDGYWLNKDGAWIENHVVQTKTVEIQKPAEYGDNYSGTYSVPCYETDGTITSQTIVVTYNPTANAITVYYQKYDATQTYNYAGKDFRGFDFFELISEEEKDAVFFSAPGIVEWPADNGSKSVPRT